VALVFADLIRQFSTTTGLGNFALTTTPAGFKSFSSVLSTGDTFYYSILNVDKPAESESGLGTWLAGGNFSRDPSIIKTNFSAGKKQVSLTVGAAFFRAVEASMAGGTAAWGNITGDITTQPDLIALLSGKANNTDIATLVGLLAGKVDTASLSELIDDRVAALLVAGTNVSLSYDDPGNHLVINSTGGGGGGGGASPGKLDFSIFANSGLLVVLEEDFA
jgi:hypothetical protein